MLATVNSRRGADKDSNVHKWGLCTIFEAYFVVK